MKWTLYGLALVGLIGGCIMLMGCSTSRYPRLTAPNPAYERALADVEPSEPPAEIKPLIALFADYSEDNIREWAPQVYADPLYFRDGFKEFTSYDALQDYLVRGAEPLRSCTFDFPAVVEQNGDYYLRWVMRVNLKRDAEDSVEEVIGMSHVRLNEEGKVVFQQDYWDPSDVLYRRIPIAGWMMHKVKSGL